MTTARAYHHGDLRRALLDAALAIVRERGGTGEVTLRDLARRVGVSHNAPYRHFPTRDALLAAVAAEGFVELSRVLEKAREGVDDDEERFVRTGLAYLRFAQRRPAHLAVMHGPEVPKSRTPELQRAANETFQVVKALASDAGITDEGEARRVGTVVWSFIHGLAALSNNRQVPASVGATPEELATLGLRKLFRAFSSSAS